MSNKNFYRAVGDMMERKSYEFGQKKVTRKILNKYKNKFDWNEVCTHQTLTESMIEDFSKYMRWKDICSHQKLSEDFIRKHMAYVDWEAVTRHQKLSITFIREFQDYIDWDALSSQCDLNLNFFDEFHKRINWTTFLYVNHAEKNTWFDILKKRYNLVAIPTYGGYLWKEEEDVI